MLYFMVEGAWLWHQYQHTYLPFFLSFFLSFFHEQGEPDICCHPSLLCAAGTAGGVCSQRRACSSGGRDGNWEDFHCPTPGQSHRWAQEPSLAVPPSLLESTCPEFQIMPDVHKYRVLFCFVLFFFYKKKTVHTSTNWNIPYCVYNLGHRLRVVNMNQQSDTADLLGGWVTYSVPK